MPEAAPHHSSRDATKVVPISQTNNSGKREKPKRQFRRSRQRSVTSQLFDANLEAVATRKLNVADEKRRASIRLERRKTLRRNTSKEAHGINVDQVKSKSVKRERSLTAKLTRKSFAAERMFESILPYAVVSVP